MDLTLKEFVQILFAAFTGGVAAYAAIKSDLAAHGARLKLVEESADKAHERIDAVLMAGSAKGN